MNCSKCDNLACGMTSDDSRHGTTNGYGNLSCRCSECRSANAEYLRTFRQSKRNGPIPDKVHGTFSGYVIYRCKCQPCVTFKRQWLKDRNLAGGEGPRILVPDSHDGRRAISGRLARRNKEIKDLYAQGLGLREIGEAYGLASPRIYEIVRNKNSGVRKDPVNYKGFVPKKSTKLMNMDRNRQMFDLYHSEGETLSEIGHKFGISRERVRQVLRVMENIERQNNDSNIS